MINSITSGPHLLPTPPVKANAPSNTTQTQHREMELKSLSDRENLLEFGRMQLGLSSVETWEKKGFEVDEATLEAAANAGIEAAKNLFDSGKQGGVTINSHKIVMDNQSVPEWFNVEYQAQLDALPNDTRKAFESGATYNVNIIEAGTARALSSYGNIFRS